MNFSKIWLSSLRNILTNGEKVWPRDKLTLEILHDTMVIDMRQPVLCVSRRGLSYRFMAAEAYWILSGDDRVATIAPYNGHLAEFSDDGERFFGAYGPKIQAQLPYVLDKLSQDLQTRQAGLTIWRESPPATKDVPCTVAIFFSVRHAKLNTHVFMRSSDLWLGVPYDVFNFSMLGHLVCAELNTRFKSSIGLSLSLEPGLLYLTAASRHLYEPSWVAAEACIKTTSLVSSPLTPTSLYAADGDVLGYLKELRESSAGDKIRWWEANP